MNSSNSPGTSSHEFLAAAEKYIGNSAIVHQEFSPHCWKLPYTPALCMEIGMSPTDGFDCSGLALRSLCDILGGGAAHLATVRHTRQIWADATGTQTFFNHPSALPNPGDLAIFWRRWDTPTGPKRIPAHTAIVSDATPGKELIIHAHSPNEIVAKEALDRFNQATLLGFVSVKSLDTLTTEVIQ